MGATFTTLRGTPAFGAAKFGNGLTTGVLGSTTSISSAVGTFECWVKTTTGSFLIALGNNGAGYWIGVQSGKALMGTPNSSLNSGVTINDGAWHHLAGTSDGTARKFYVDGVLTGTQTISSSFVFGTATTAIGGYGTNTTYEWVGIVDEVRFSSVVRYTANFIPSPAAFSGDTDTIGLYHLESDGSDSSAASAGGSGAAGYSGAGTLSATGAATIAAPAGYTGSGALTSTSAPGAASPASYTGVGALTTVGAPTPAGTASYTGAGALTVSGTATASTTSSYSGSGNLQAVTALTAVGTGAYAGAGALTAATAGSGASNPTYTGSGTLGASSAPSITGPAAYTGSGQLAAIAASGGATSTSYTGTGQISVTGLAASSRTVAYSGSGSLTSTGTPSTPVPASTGRLRFGSTPIRAMWFAGKQIRAIAYGVNRIPLTTLALAVPGNGVATVSGDGVVPAGGVATLTSNAYTVLGAGVGRITT